VSNPPQNRAIGREPDPATETGPAQGGSEAQCRNPDAARAPAGEPSRRDGIFAALRRSPLVGADLDVTGEEMQGRDVAP
jgi:hypothetical protein